MQVQIIQGGKVLPQHTHDGQNFIEVPRAGEYQIRIRNTSGVRKLAVISVDGVNIVDGETAGYEGTGYVLGAWQTTTIKGWRRSDSEVAAFSFDESGKSYANQTGRGKKNTGVIGLAIFDEKPKATNFLLSYVSHDGQVKGTFTPESSTRTYGAKLDSAPLYRDIHDGDLDGDIDTVYAANAAAAAACADEPDSIPCSAQTSGTLSADTISARGSGVLRGAQPRRRRVTKRATNLGTGYGGRTTMYTTETTFERATETPAQVLTFRYGVRAKLREWGVPLPKRHVGPSAFPASEGPSVPEPPGWRG